MYSREAMIATNRFGLGARPGEAQQASSDPRGWLKAQLSDPNASRISGNGLVASDVALQQFFAFREMKKNNKESGKAGQKNKVKASDSRPEMGTPRALIGAEIEARTRQAITTSDSFRERLVRFWSNHFTVSVTDTMVVAVAGAFEREAIRPHVTGRFEDMLLAAEMHPAMLVYLDNAQSIGPNSRVGSRRDLGLNENLAREILELHTLGVNGGYTQEDVIQFAEALTGWTISTPRDQVPDGKTWFDERRHEPGSVVVMGRRHTDEGAEQALSVMRDLARRPQTADYVAERMARHFIADEPPETAVKKLSQSFKDSGGDLRHLSATLVDIDEAWSADLAKFKTPDEFHISTLRGMGAQRMDRRTVRNTYGSLGQTPFNAPSPAGWPDEATAWLGPDAVKKRLEWSQAVAGKTKGRLDPGEYLDNTVGEFASQTTTRMVRGADSRMQGLTLALMAPEFQRR